ncbi:Eukaryotic translation initiation factor 2-alpha kinase [Orbilia javanica]|uniref:non-specific serine/threonine protein kinase n=1 Tax=Orbilia javanica TaxID=47235 RepID=A0AAN8RMB7_9PEZI
MSGSPEFSDAGFRQYRQIDGPTNSSVTPREAKQSDEFPESTTAPRDSYVSSVPRDQNPFDSTNRDHLKMLLQATSTEHHLRNILSKPEYKYTSAEEKQRIIDESLKKMVSLGVVDPRILDFGGRLFEGHRTAVSAYLGSLVGAISGGSVEAKALEQALQRSGLEPPTSFQAHAPRTSPGAAGNQVDDYSAIFGPRWEDLECLGRGGFGSVWSCKNLLDGEVYAIKKIIITEPFLRAARIVDEKAREKAFAELHHEVKVLARLDHPNIVRYYGSWMERMSRDQFEKVKTELCPDQSELEDYTEERTWDSSVSGQVFGKGYSEQESENDDESEDDESETDESEGDNSDGHGQHYDSYDESEGQENSQPGDSGSNHSEEEALGNSISGGVSLLSLNSDSKDTESELIQRSDRQLTLLPSQSSPHVHILSIQMAQYSLSLDDLINTPRESNSPLKHFDFSYTYHPKTAIQIMLRIVDAVEYMHHHNLVHRDLKPANIFLKVEKGPIGEMNGSIRVAGCKCSHRGHTCVEGGDCLPGDLCWVTPKIGDFGLTADIKRVLGNDGKPALQGPVGGGTALYMPPAWAEEACSDASHVSKGQRGPHLGDSYALGIMFFELLYGFGTATERNILIHKLREAERSDNPFPADFCKQYLLLLGGGLLEKIKSIIVRLTCNKHNRLCISELKGELEETLPLL